MHNEHIPDCRSARLAQRGEMGNFLTLPESLLTWAADVGIVDQYSAEKQSSLQEFLQKLFVHNPFIQVWETCKAFVL